VRGVVASVLAMITDGARYVGVATDHVIESFRNRLWSGYKTGEGIDPDLLSQFQLLEDTLTAAGIVVWPMIEYEADDALASAAAAAARDERVTRVVICTPDKDLAQSVRGSRVVQLNRRTNTIRDEAGVIAKFGVPPESVPDYLALVGDSADGYPGLAGWGPKSTAAVLARFGGHPPAQLQRCVHDRRPRRSAPARRHRALPAAPIEEKYPATVIAGGGSGRSRTVTSVTMPSVPSDPTSSEVRS